MYINITTDDGELLERCRIDDEDLETIKRDLGRTHVHPAALLTSLIEERVVDLQVDEEASQ